MPADNNAVLLPLSIIGTALSICLSLSQLPRIRRVIREKDASLASPLSNFLLLLNSVLWCGCAIFIQQRWDLFAVNAIGAGFTASFAAVMIVYERQRTRKLLHIAAIVAAFLFPALLFLILFVFPSRKSIPRERAALLANGITVVVNSAMFAGPALSVYRALQDKSIAGVPVLLTAVAFLCALCWMSFGIALGPDFFVTIPNAIGVLLSGAQLSIILFVTLRNRASKRRLEKAVLLVSDGPAPSILAGGAAFSSREAQRAAVGSVSVDGGSRASERSGKAIIVSRELPLAKLGRGEARFVGGSSHHSLTGSGASSATGGSYGSSASSARLRRKSSLSGEGSAIGVIAERTGGVGEEPVQEDAVFASPSVVTVSITVNNYGNRQLPLSPLNQGNDGEEQRGSQQSQQPQQPSRQHQQAQSLFLPADPFLDQQLNSATSSAKTPSANAPVMMVIESQQSFYRVPLPPPDPNQTI